ncbi:MAG: FHA domain-containing protein [Phycisphaeraceae bacterium]|nr:FHA domain-containing protein [Phycisphaeraceae bacterium]
MQFRLDTHLRDGSRLSFLIARPQTTVGRRAACDIHIALPIVEPLHCCIHWDGATVLVLEDHGTRLGTRVNGTAVHRCLLAGGDRIAIGPVEFIVCVLDPPAAAAGAADAERRAAPLVEVEPGARRTPARR